MKIHDFCIDQKLYILQESKVVIMSYVVQSDAYVYWL